MLNVAWVYLNVTTYNGMLFYVTDDHLLVLVLNGTKQWNASRNVWDITVDII